MEGGPFLEMLSVNMYHSVQDDHRDGPCFPLFDDYTPRFRSCSFTSFNLGWVRRMMSGLCILHSWGSRNGYSPSIDTLHCSCPDP
ncbi:hypothetical protein EDD16DRAFT_1583439 [Pisolithus croceorrhizus]|nr:hypothetical protein EDD16DRAFT_1583439 [Pisolithus croceorrhizus]